MKKILSLFAIMAVLAMGFASCEDKDPKDFKITVSEVTETTANVLVEPADTTATYYLTCYQTKSIATMDDDSLSLVIAAELEFLRQLASAAYGTEFTTTEVLEIVLMKGKQEQALKSMNPGTDYTVVVAKMDFQGVINGKIAKKNFTTKEIVYGQMTFSFENTGASVIVTPSNNYEPWDYCFFTPEQYAAYPDKNAAAAEVYAYYGTELASPGAKEFPFALMASDGLTGDVVLITYACDDKGITSEVAEYKFNVPAAAGAPAKKIAKETIVNFKKMMNVEKKFNAIKAMKK